MLREAAGPFAHRSCQTAVLSCPGLPCSSVSIHCSRHTLADCCIVLQWGWQHQPSDPASRLSLRSVLRESAEAAVMDKYKNMGANSASGMVLDFSLLLVTACCKRPSSRMSFLYPLVLDLVDLSPGVTKVQIMPPCIIVAIFEPVVRLRD